MKQLITDNVDLSNEVVFKQWVKDLQGVLTVEDWHEVGAINQPAFTNSWVNFDAIRKARFYKDAFGVVHIAGLVKSGVVNSPIFTLPAGYLPSYVNISSPDLLFVVPSNSTYGQISVNYLGEVNLTIGSNAWASLDGISFRV